MNASLLEHFDRVADAPDAVKRFRYLVRDLAVSGKLVRQDPNEEPASILLAKIKSSNRKAALSAAQIARLRSGQNGTPSIPPPKGWSWTALGSIIELLSGQHLQPGEYNISEHGSLPYITGPADFGLSGLTITKYAAVRKAVAVKGQILITVKGAGIGKTAICDRPEVAISRQLMAMTPIEWDYEFLLLTTHKLTTALQNSARSLIPGISREDICNFVFALPPLVEQHRIVAKVAELMVLCDEIESERAKREAARDRFSAATLARLSAPEPDPVDFADHVRFTIHSLDVLTTRHDQIKTLRETILTLAVRGKLVPQDSNEEPASELLKRNDDANGDRLKQTDLSVDARARDLQISSPAGWVLVPLAAISKRIQYGFTASADNDVRTVRMLRITDIQDNTVDWLSVPGCIIEDKQVDQYKLKRGDILIARTGGTIGKTFLIREMPVVAVFASYLIRVQGTAHVFDEYLKLFLESPLYWIQLYQGARGTGQPNVNGQTLGKLLVPLPPLAEQHRIVNKVDELMAVCNRLEASLAAADVVRRQLLDSVIAQSLSSSQVA